MCSSLQTAIRLAVYISSSLATISADFIVSIFYNLAELPRLRNRSVPFHSSVAILRRTVSGARACTQHVRV